MVDNSASVLIFLALIMLKMKNVIHQTLFNKKIKSIQGDIPWNFLW
ncbi:Uncharacterised protein, partial [Metamycoplasma alkalescens]